MTNSFIKSVLLVTLAYASMQAHAALNLQLKEFAEVTSRHVKLSDIIVPKESENPQLIKQLGGIEVATIAHVNQPLRIEAKQLIHLVSRLQPALAGQFDFTGAKAVIVTWPANSFPTAKVSEAAENFIKAQLHERGLDFSIQELFILPRTVQLPLGQVSLSARFDKPFQPAQKLRVMVDIFVDGKPTEKIPVEAKLEMQIKAYQLTRALKSGEALQPEDIRQVQLSVNEVAKASSLASAANTLQGARLRKNLEANAVLQVSDIEAIPYVTKTQEISAEIRTDNIVIEKRVIAESDGRLGQKIKVSDPSSSTSFYATVVAPRRVEIQ